ncbi:MAG: PAS domain S-box protein, partial [Gammaproteobacteria bacterium]|nr:PAS domain S-box protein [Gammaproteobacteria bacterium]
MSDSNGHDYEQQLLSLQQEIEQLRKENSDLEERLRTYSFVNSGQVSLINKFIDKVPFAVMLIDEQQNIIHSNTAAQKLFSSSEPEMSGQHCTQYFKCFDQKKGCPVVIAENEVTLKHIESAKGDKFIMHSAFVSGEGSDKFIVETFIDISEIKNAEQELVKTNKMKDEFLGMISHELRTPLNVIQGYSSLLDVELGENKNKDVAMYIDNIKHSGEILLRLVNNLLELSDLTAGKVKVDNIPMELEVIVTQLKYRLQPDLEQHANKLIYHYEDIPPFEQDLALLMKVLFEVLVNA